MQNGFFVNFSSEKQSLQNAGLYATCVLHIGHRGGRARFRMYFSMYLLGFRSRLVAIFWAATISTATILRAGIFSLRVMPAMLAREAIAERIESAY